MKTLKQIMALVKRRKVMISDHRYDELAEDAITVKDIISDVANGIVVENYPDYFKGPCFLVLQKDSQGNPIHAVWGIPKGSSSPAVLITAYRPDPDRRCFFFYCHYNCFIDDRDSFCRAEQRGGKS